MSCPLGSLASRSVGSVTPSISVGTSTNHSRRVTHGVASPSTTRSTRSPDTRSHARRRRPAFASGSKAITSATPIAWKRSSFSSSVCFSLSLGLTISTHRSGVPSPHVFHTGMGRWGTPSFRNASGAHLRLASRGSRYTKWSDPTAPGSSSVATLSESRTISRCLWCRLVSPISHSGSVAGKSTGRTGRTWRIWGSTMLPSVPSRARACMVDGTTRGVPGRGACDLTRLHGAEVAVASSRFSVASGQRRADLERRKQRGPRDHSRGPRVRHLVSPVTRRATAAPRPSPHRRERSRIAPARPLRAVQRPSQVHHGTATLLVRGLEKVTCVALLGVLVANVLAHAAAWLA